MKQTKKSKKFRGANISVSHLFPKYLTSKFTKVYQSCSCVNHTTKASMRRSRKLFDGWYHKVSENECPKHFVVNKRNKSLNKKSMRR